MNKPTWTSLCKSCKYRCKGSGFVDSCSSYKFSNPHANSMLQLTIYDELSDRHVERKRVGVNSK